MQEDRQTIIKKTGLPTTYRMLLEFWERNRGDNPDWQTLNGFQAEFLLWRDCQEVKPDTFKMAGGGQEVSKPILITYPLDQIQLGSTGIEVKVKSLYSNIGHYNKTLDVWLAGIYDGKSYKFIPIENPLLWQYALI